MTAPVAVSLTKLTLTDDEQREVGKLRAQLAKYEKINALKSAYYEGEYQPRQLNISVPPSLADIEVANGWPQVVVDANAELHACHGWTAAKKDDLMGLDEVFEDAQLESEQSMTATESILTGVGWNIVGRGEDDEPDIIVTSESSMDTTGVWDRRRRRCSSAYSRTVEDGKVILETLYLPGTTISFQKSARGGMTVVDRDDHGLGRVPVIRFPNRSRPSDVDGKSEITRAVRYLTDAALRTLLGMEINREFYTAPSRAVLGADPEQLGFDEDMDREAKVRAGWSVMMGRLNIIPRDDDGEIATLHEYKPAPPTPYVEQMRGYALALSTATAIPAASLGVHTDNPAAADAIAREEKRLVGRAELRNRQWTRDMMELAYVALLWRDQKVDTDRLRRVTVDWANPATPTRSAEADYASKLVSTKVLPPDSSVTYKRIGLSKAEIEQVTEDKRRGGMSDLLARLPGSNGAES